ncbi:sulfite exporter TauE/SafE family protein [Methylonatrum kenyense]|uniref:sulfite exporter TauE/SafE family protein n=1 Tax=Methylonatrum kenyense TaxID=455253 RepID=UPI0020BDF4FC|nr:sulfite exporter TauE/SafE family protein [Methylonatrum kenyense]MCK8516023.1 sulfite exporter TauE/SafE family protein [Methylonatrum kenyense]
MSALDWLLASMVLLVCAVIQGAIGFGVGLLGAPLLYLINPALVPAPVIIVGMVLPALIVLRDWRHVHGSDVAWALPGTLFGTLLGGLVIGVLSTDGLALLFGGLVLLAVAISLVGLTPRPTPGVILTGGGLSGFMATTTAIGGPPLALIFQHLRGPRLRGTLSAIFFPGGVLALASLYWAGRFGAGELMMGIALLPAIGLGFILSGRFAGWLDRRWLRPAILSLSTAAALIAITRALPGIL